MERVAQVIQMPTHIPTPTVSAPTRSTGAGERVEARTPVEVGARDWATPALRFAFGFAG